MTDRTPTIEVHCDRRPEDCLQGHEHGKGSYEVDAGCFNCNWHGKLRVDWAHPVPRRADCPSCGCYEVRQVMPR